MKPTLCFTAVAAAFAFSGAALAAGQAESSMTDPVKKQTFSALDRDNDGSLSMMEAAADPDAKQQFKELDTNNDYQLSRSEYEALEKLSSETIGGAAAGGSAQSGVMKPKQSFTELDRDNDGSLSRSEYERLEMAQGEQDKTWVEKSQQTYEERSK